MSRAAGINPHWPTGLGLHERFEIVSERSFAGPRMDRVIARQAEFTDGYVRVVTGNVPLVEVTRPIEVIFMALIVATPFRSQTFVE